MIMRGQSSTLSVCVHVHTHYKKTQWCMFGGTTPHEEEAEGGMFSPAVLEERRYGEANRLEATALNWTHAGQMMQTPIRNAM